MDLLKGIRVVDVTTWAFVPAAGGILAHWGADVIKIEHPRDPDPMRAWSSAPGASSNMFKHYNRGKRGITLDLSRDEGRDVLYRLVDQADVFLTNFLTDPRKKLRIDVADIKARNPRIVYAKGSGRGPRGPLAERGAYDLATWWGRGSLAYAAQAAAGVEYPPGLTGHGDGMSGHVLAGGVCAALLQRERTGMAPVVDGSLLGTAIWFNGPAINLAAEGEVWKGGGGKREERNAIGNNYRTKDGSFIQLTMLGEDPDWVDLAEHIGRPELGTDPRFATTDERHENKRELIAILDDFFAQHTEKEVHQILATTRGVWEPIQNPWDILEDVQTIANGFVRKARYPDGSELSLVAPAVLFDEDTGEPEAAPEWGQHTDEVLAELGMSAEEIGQYRERGVIR